MRLKCQNGTSRNATLSPLEVSEWHFKTRLF
jgi:hypothetical protein